MKIKYHCVTRNKNITLMTQILRYVGYLGNLYLNATNDKSEHIKTIKTDNIIIKKISVGGYHILILSDKNKLYGIGSNGEGQLGFSPGIKNNFDTITEIEVKLDKNQCIVDVCATGRTSYITLNTGQIMSFGANNYYQLGLSYDFDHSYIPTIIPGLNNYKCYIKGKFWWGMHVLTTSGKVFSFGDNSYGKLGLGNGSIIKGPTINENLQKLNGKLSMVAEGAYHTMFLTTKGKVYVCGNNWYYQLGNDVHTVRNAAHTPTSVDSLDSKFVTDIYSTSSSLACKTICDKVYVWGNNSNNRTGIKTNDEYIRTPTLLASNIKILSTGSNHIAFADSNNDVNTCGLNEHFQCGRQEQDKNLFAELGVMKKTFDVDNIICGSFFTLFVTDFKAQYFRRNFGKICVQFSSNNYQCDVTFV